MISNRLISDWRRVLRKAWSIRLAAVAALLTGCEVVLPLYSDDIPRSLFAGLTFFFVIGAMIARLVAQKEFSQ